MKGKEFHIITVGNSLIGHFKNKKVDNYPVIKEARMGDDVWERMLDDPSFIDAVYNFLCENPSGYSAELRYLFKYREKKEINLSDCEIYLAGTKTASNEIVVRVLTRFLKNQGVNAFYTFSLPGYFHRDYEIRVDEFVKGLSEMLDKFVYLARKKKDEGYKVIFGAVGGFKAHVVVCALAGFLTGSEVYYIHEEFNDLIGFPPLFYLPKRKEMEVLKILSDKKPISGKECEDLLNKYPEEIDWLNFYGLVDIETNEFGKRFRIKITNIGLWALRYLEKRFI